MAIFKEKGVEDMLTVVGGVIPNRDIPILKDIGVVGVFPGGTPFVEIVDFIKGNTSRN